MMADNSNLDVLAAQATKLKARTNVRTKALHMKPLIRKDPVSQ
jgi:hypothetical protein